MNQSDDEHGHAREHQSAAGIGEVDGGRKNHEIQEEQNVVQGKTNETPHAPEQQRRGIAPVLAIEQHRAENARETAKTVNNLSDHFSFLIRNASAK